MKKFAGPKLIKIRKKYLLWQYQTPYAERNKLF